ncbi:MAG: Ppx/GppA family phosphatase [Gammaproteobacteria bacterium]|nr:Ppx/GppA family phosphatase [Gammaproteobacteria bacterium]
MIVARLHHGQLAVVDRLREMVRLASGLSAQGDLDDDSQQRALDCLRRFGQRLRDMQAHQVRVVGTSALRRARHADAFLAAAEAALGHPVEVISGVEEARLIYLGVSRHADRGPGTTLVVDVGGGSTELIVGEGDEPRRLESLKIGCVGISEQFFDGGRLSQRRFDRARLEVRRELRAAAGAFKRLGWTHAIGSSGTVRTAGDVAQALGAADRGVTPQALDGIIGRMIDARRLSALKLPGLGPDRAPVFAGGVAILAEVMSELGIERLEVSEGALREGLLYDILGRLRHDDAREVSVRAMQRRYHVDQEQAERVAATAELLLSKVDRSWALGEPRYGQLLRWAAALHEVGLDIAHSKYHQHGGYLLAHADMPGFVRLEQQLLATLVASHRRKLDMLTIERLPASWRLPLSRLIVLLRLAVLLNRGRSGADVDELCVETGERALTLELPEQWFERNPLTHADLDQERLWLEAAGFDLRLGTLPRQEASAS